MGVCLLRRGSMALLGVRQVSRRAGIVSPRCDRSGTAQARTHEVI